ncbi:hypothetical protein GEMRC1_001518 [Eukaryota sp. GEM-RC1]
MAFVFSVAGFGLGALLMLAVGWLSSYTLRLMVLNGKLSRRYSYRHVAARALGSSLSKVVDVMISSYGFGLLIAYWNILGDFIPPVIRGLFSLFGVHLSDTSFYTSGPIVALIVGFIGVFPLCCLRNMEPLGFTSGVALGGICLTVVGVGIQFFITIGKVGFGTMVSSVQWFNFSFDVFRIIPIISLSFSAHLGVLRLYQELHQRSVKRMFGVVMTAVCLNFFFYTLCGGLGYFSFGSETAPNLINSYDEDSMLRTMSQIAMIFVIGFSYPLIQYPVRKALIQFCPERHSKKLHYPFTMILFFVPYLISLLIDDLSIILGFLGSTFGIMLSYILPGVLFLKLRNTDFGVVDSAQSKTSKADFGVLGALLCIIGGGIIGIIGFSMNLRAVLTK